MATLLADFSRDCGIAARWLRRSPGFAGMAALALGLGLGLNLALFQILGGLLLHPLPYPRDGQLVWAQPVRRNAGATQPLGYSPPDFLDYRRAARSFSSLAAYYPNAATLSGSGPAERVDYTNVSAGFFETLGAKPALGRAILPSDEIPALPEVAVLSDGLWQRRYGGDPRIVGKVIGLENRLVTVVGVMPPGFAYPAKSQLWMSEPFTNPLLLERGARFLEVIGRLAPAATPRSAQAEMQSLGAGLAAQYPDLDRDLSTQVEPLAQHMEGNAGPALWSLLAAAGLVLLLGCANLANLLLARAAGRGPEMAVRASLGATRGRLGRQLLTESLMLAALGGVAGAGLAVAAGPLLRGLLPVGVTAASAAANLGALAGFPALILIAGLLVGWAPMRQLARQQPARHLRQGFQTTAGPDSRRFQSALAAAEIAIAMLLLLAAAGLLRHWLALRDVDPGFQPDHVLTAEVSIPASTVAEMRAGRAFFETLNQRVRGLPGIAAAGMISELPLSGQRANLRFSVIGAPPLPPTQRPEAGFRRVLPGYFAAMRIPVLRGRGIAESDTDGGAPVAVVDESLAAALFPGRSPIGESLMLDSGRPHAVAIVGEVGAVRQDSLAAAPAWQIYAPFPQAPAADMTIVARVRDTPLAHVAALRGAVAGLDTQIPLYGIATMDAVMAQATAGARGQSQLFLALAGLALALAGAGVYAALAHGVALRKKEIGIRLALGADPAAVRRMVLAQALRLGAVGIGCGLAAAAGLRQLLASRWPDFVAPSPAAVALLGLFLFAAALAASFFPARRASRIDPAKAISN